MVRELRRTQRAAEEELDIEPNEPIESTIDAIEETISTAIDQQQPVSLFDGGSFIFNESILDENRRVMSANQHNTRMDGFSKVTCTEIECERFIVTPPIVPIGGDDKLKYFKGFFSDERISYIYCQTNSSSKKDNTGNPIQLHEIRKFIAICLYMTIVDPLQEKMLWIDADDVVHTRQQFISDLLPLRRFRFIKKHFRVTISDVDPNSQTPASQNKTKKLVEMVNNMIRKPISPQKELCIDESMVAWTGRSQAKVWCKAKMTKRALSFTPFESH